MYITAWLINIEILSFSVIIWVCLPVLNDAVRDQHPLQIILVVFRHAETVEIKRLPHITNLKTWTETAQS